MPMNLKKEVFLNSIFAIITNVVVLVLGVVVPRIMIRSYGSDVNGLISTVTQIYTYLALLEAGISVASRNALYKHIKNKDQNGINYTLSVSRLYFRKASLIYCLGVIAVSFIAPLVLKTQINYWIVFSLIAIEGISNVLSFYFLNYWLVFLSANGKNYIVLLIDFLVKLLFYIIKIVLALNGISILLVQLSFFLLTIIKVLLFNIFFKKKYSWIKIQKVSKKDKLPDRNSFVVTEVAWAVFSSTDLILIGIFLSTSISSVYSIYNMVFLAITNLVSAIYNGLIYILGISFKQDLKKYSIVHDIFNSAFMCIITSFVSTAYLLMIPFIILYTNGVSDINYIYQWLPLLFSIIQLLSWSRYVAGNLSGIAGYAKKVSIVSIIEAAVNISVSIVLVNVLGIYGVLLGTISALPIKVIYLNWLADNKVLNRSMKKTILILLCNYAFFGIVVIYSLFFNQIKINNLYDFIYYGFKCFFLIFSLNIIVNILCNKNLLYFTSIARRYK